MHATEGMTTSSQPDGVLRVESSIGEFLKRFFDTGLRLGYAKRTLAGGIDATTTIWNLKAAAVTDR